MSNDEILKLGLYHPCRKKCSGWKDGFNCGREYFDQLLLQAEGLAAALEKIADRVVKCEKDSFNLMTPNTKIAQAALENWRRFKDGND